jgi:hypothetical protein
VSSIQTINNWTGYWVRFRNSEWSQHNRWIGPYSSVSFEWHPWVPYAASQTDFDWPHWMSFTSAPGVPDAHFLRWYMYERWGYLEVFRDGYQSGRSPGGFPMIGRDQLVVYIGPEPELFLVGWEGGP